MNKIAIVIGATGLIGRALIDQLVDAEHISKIITLTRSQATHPSSKVENHVINFDNLIESKHLFKGDYFFSCLGTTIKQAGTIGAQRKVDVDYQLKAAHIAADNGVAHYLLVSSTGANTQSNRPYLRMKGELDQKIKALPFKRISIFQPSLLLGHRDEVRMGEKIGGWLMTILCIIPWFRHLRPIKGEQVAAKMIKVSQQQGASIERFCLDELFNIV